MASSALKAVDLFDRDGNPRPGLVALRQSKNSLNVDECAAVIEAEQFPQIDFVFFRRFSDGRSSQIAAYVVDNENERLSEFELAELHRDLWLNGSAPLLYVAWPTRIDVLTCARGPDFLRSEEQVCSYAPFDTIQVAAAINEELQNRTRYSAFRLADGTFWDDPRNSRLAKHAAAAHQLLIQAVVDTERELDGANAPVMRRLLLLMVLIKYLEDRQVFPRGWFAKYQKGEKTFFDVLDGGDPAEVQSLLSALERRFNGDIFALPVEGSQRLTAASLRRFASLVGAKTLKGQQHFWKLFSFAHLPVEIISHLYQRFVQAGHGAVYTAPFLASLLLDRAMPYDELTGTERVLDPACGSGVFLVGAFRRLVNVWRSKNEWKRPDVNGLREILARSIYGIELDGSALDLTAFSLALAVCDALKPDVIWKELRFEKLRGRSLVEADFFDLILRSKTGAHTIFDKPFDVVIGNPPFESTLSEAGRQLNDLAIAARGDLPDSQIAYLFFEQSLEVTRPNSKVCVIQPSGLLYNRKAETFQKQLFAKHRIETIFDFTSIRNLYEADPKTVAILAQKIAPTGENVIEHLTFRRTFSVHERICFELDHYDRHLVRQPIAVAQRFVWRVNLLGGGRLLDIARRISKMETLAEYIGKQNGWDYGEGFIAAKSGKRDPAPFLTGKPMCRRPLFKRTALTKTSSRL